MEDISIYTLLSLHTAEVFFYSEVVITLDFESSIPGSNPGRRIDDEPYVLYLHSSETLSFITMIMRVIFITFYLKGTYDRDK